MVFNNHGKPRVSKFYDHMVRYGTRLRPSSPTHPWVRNAQRRTARTQRSFGRGWGWAERRCSCAARPQPRRMGGVAAGAQPCAR